jgi:hypothetical protein
MRSAGPRRRRARRASRRRLFIALRAGGCLRGLRLGFSRCDPVEFRLTRDAHAAIAHAHSARAASLASKFVILALRQIIPGQKFLHLERSRLAFASRADQQFKHLDGAAQLVSQFGDVGDGDVLLRTAHASTLRETALASTCNFAQARVAPGQGSIRRACKCLQLCARASSAVSGRSDVFSADRRGLGPTYADSIRHRLFGRVPFAAAVPDPAIGNPRPTAPTPC